MSTSVFSLSIHFMPHKSAVAECVSHVMNIHEMAFFKNDFHNVKSILHLHTITKASHVQPSRTGKTVSPQFIDSIRRTAECIFMPCFNFNKAKRHSIPRNDVNFTMTIADIPLKNIQSKLSQRPAGDVLSATPQSQMGCPQPPETPRPPCTPQSATRLSYYLIYKTSDFLPFQHGNRSTTHYFMDMTCCRNRHSYKMPHLSIYSTLLG